MPDSITKEVEPVSRDLQGSEARSLQADWTREEELKAKRKLDLTIMPLLVLGFFCLQLDRGNIANAITDTFLEDVGITQFQFNVGQQLLSLGIVLFEIPSNMLIYRVGPGRWLSLQLALFGLVSTFQAFQKGYGAYLATRILLGISESGYIPGGLWTLSTWYTKKETAKRVMIFFFGNQLGQAFAKLIAYGILHMKGVGGRPGWFWLFVIMGAFTLLCAVVLGLFLPNSFGNPHSTLLPTFDIFTPRELHILRTRVLIDDPAKGRKKERIPLSSFKEALSNWRLWIHVLITLGNNGPFRGFDTYGPTIIKSFGYPSLDSNALAAVGLFLQIPVSFIFSYISDRFDKRGETVMVGLGMHLIGYMFNRIFTELNQRGVRYFGVVWTQTFANFPHPLNIAWMSLVCRNQEERSISMAMIIMSANIGAIYGAQLFQEHDKPRYRVAFESCIGILGATLLLVIFRYWDDLRLRRRGRGLEQVPS